MPRQIAVAVAFLILTTSATAEVRRNCDVSYQTHVGWSDRTEMAIRVLTGKELMAVIQPPNPRLDSTGNYALLEFDQGRFAILSLDSPRITGDEFTDNDFIGLFDPASFIEATQIDDARDRKWRIYLPARLP